MTRLEDLLYSLTTVLICYHDRQAGVKCLINETDQRLRFKKSRELAIKIINEKEVLFEKKLSLLIDECTVDFARRKPFLYFILNEINFLHSMLHCGKSLTSGQLEHYKQDMARMFSDIKGLLTTPKTKTYDVKYISTESGMNKTVSLSGAVENSYYSTSPLCISGYLLQEVVFKRLNLSEESSAEEIMSLASNMCDEHQNALLIPELISEKADLAESMKLQKMAMEKLQLQLQEAQLKLLEQANMIEAKSSNPGSQDAMIGSLRKRLGESEKQISELQKTNQEQREKISSLKKGMGIAPLLFSGAYGPIFHHYNRTTQLSPIPQVEQHSHKESEATFIPFGQ